MTPAEVADAVFGAYTRDVPAPYSLFGGEGRWSWFFRTPMPEWWVEPEPPYYGWAALRDALGLTSQTETDPAPRA